MKASTWLAAAALAVACVASACAGESVTDKEGRVMHVDGPSGVTTLLFDPGARSSDGARGEAVTTHRSALLAASPASVTVFYPQHGESQQGLCFVGVFADGAGNIYPVHAQGVFKVLPDGTLVNGVSDMGFFLNDPFDFYATLDVAAGTAYSAAFGEVRSAPFTAGASFSTRVNTGTPDAHHAVLGRGPLAGSIIASQDDPAQLLRVILAPPSVSVLATGMPAFARPASAPNGDLYLPDFTVTPPAIIRVTPSGQRSTFAVGTAATRAQTSQSVEVDATGNVYWTQDTGINVYAPNGQLRSVLPGPPDSPAFGGPTDMAFDPQGDLFVVENQGCKKMYKYDLTCAGTAPPAFTFVPPAVTTSSCGAIAIGAATAADGCGPVTVTSNAPASFPVGRTVVTWTATGSAGLTATATQVVTRVLTSDAACCPAGTNVIVGTSNSDVINGTAAADCILGLGGQDIINGAGANDLISGGDGDDVITGGIGNDVVFGGSGRDRLNGNDGADFLDGGDGDDQCAGGAGNDVITGGQGQDRLFGDDGADALIGGAGDDRLEGGAGNDTLDGSGLHDVCIGGPGTDTFLICETQTQ